MTEEVRDKIKMKETTKKEISKIIAGLEPATTKRSLSQLMTGEKNISDVAKKLSSVLENQKKYPEAVAISRAGNAKPSRELVYKSQKELLRRAIIWRFNRLEESISQYGQLITETDVKQLYASRLDDIVKNKQYAINAKKIERITGVKFNVDKIVPDAYRGAMKKGYVFVMEDICKGTGKNFLPKTKKDCKLIDELYKHVSRWDNLGLPSNIVSIETITGIAPPKELLHRVAREKAQKVVEGELHEDYFHEFVKATGMKELESYLSKGIFGTVVRCLTKQSETK